MKLFYLFVIEINLRFNSKRDSTGESPVEEGIVLRAEDYSYRGGAEYAGEKDTRYYFTKIVLLFMHWQGLLISPNRGKELEQ